MSIARRLLQQLNEGLTTDDLKAARPGDKFYYLDGRGQVRSVTVIEKLKKLEGVYRAGQRKSRWGILVQYDHHIEKADKLNDFGFTERLPPPTSIVVGDPNRSWFKSPQEVQADWAEENMKHIHGQQDRLSQIASQQGNDKAMDRAAAERAMRIEKLKRMMQSESLNEADFDDEDTSTLANRILKQSQDQAKDVVKDAFGPNAKEGPVSDSISIKKGKLRPIKSYTDAEFYKAVLNTHDYFGPALARQIAMRLLGDSYRRLPRLGYEMNMGTIPVLPPDEYASKSPSWKNDLDMWGDKYRVTMVRDAQGYRLSTHRGRY